MAFHGFGKIARTIWTELRRRWPHHGQRGLQLTADRTPPVWKRIHAPRLFRGRFQQMMFRGVAGVPFFPQTTKCLFFCAENQFSSEKSCLCSFNSRRVAGKALSEGRYKKVAGELRFSLQTSSTMEQKGAARPGSHWVRPPARSERVAHARWWVTAKQETHHVTHHVTRPVWLGPASLSVGVRTARTRAVHHSAPRWMTPRRTQPRVQPEIVNKPRSWREVQIGFGDHVLSEVNYSRGEAGPRARSRPRPALPALRCAPARPHLYR